MFGAVAREVVYVQECVVLLYGCMMIKMKNEKSESE